MLSEREVKSAISSAVKKYARTQANLFFIKNRLDERVDNDDVDYLENLFNMISEEGPSVMESSSDKFFNQPNYVDFYNSLIESDKKEEVRTFCIEYPNEIRKFTVRQVYLAILQLIKDELQSLYD